MAVPMEGISVAIRVDAIQARYTGGWKAFAANAPSATLCRDGELAPGGFMAPQDTQALVETLEDRGLTCLDGGMAHDMPVVDQLRGPVASCDTIECESLDLEDCPERRVLTERLKGSAQELTYTPDERTFEASLTRSFGFVPEGHLDRGLAFLRHENGLEVYLDTVTGKAVEHRAAGIPREGWPG